MTRLQAILEELNAYEEEGGDNIWQDIVYHLPEFNEDATLALDRSNRSDRIVLDIDGRRVEVYYDYPRARWVADR